VAGTLWLTRGYDPEAFVARRMGVGEPGRALGLQSGAEACIERGLARSALCPRLDVACFTAANLFTRSCLSEASLPPRRCEGVPGPNRVLEGTRWRERWCEDAGLEGNHGCEAIAVSVQEACHSR